MVGKTLGRYEILEPLGKGGMGEVYRPHSLRSFRCAASLLALMLAPGCAGRESDPPPLTAEVPLHLEEHIDAANVIGSEVQLIFLSRSSGASTSRSPTGIRS